MIDKSSGGISSGGFVFLTLDDAAVVGDEKNS